MLAGIVLLLVSISTGKYVPMMFDVLVNNTEIHPFIIVIDSVITVFDVCLG